MIARSVLALAGLLFLATLPAKAYSLLGEKGLTSGNYVMEVANPEPVGSFRYGAKCGIRVGNEVAVVAEDGGWFSHRVLLSYDPGTSTLAADECPKGTVFWVDLVSFSYFADAFRERQEVKGLLEKSKAATK